MLIKSDFRILNKLAKGFGNFFFANCLLPFANFLINGFIPIFTKNFAKKTSF